MFEGDKLNEFLYIRASHTESLLFCLLLCILLVIKLALEAEVVLV